MSRTSSGQPASFRKEAKYYTIIREHLFEEQFAEIMKGVNLEKVEDIENNIDWALCREPTYFQNLSGPFYLWRSGKIDDSIPQLSILYEFNEVEETVNLLAVKIAEN